MEEGAAFKNYFPVLLIFSKVDFFKINNPQFFIIIPFIVNPRLSACLLFMSLSEYLWTIKNPRQQHFAVGHADSNLIILNHELLLTAYANRRCTIFTRLNLQISKFWFANELEFQI